MGIMVGGVMFLVSRAQKKDLARRKAVAAAEGLELDEYEARFPRSHEAYKKLKLELLEALVGRFDRIESRIDAIEKGQEWPSKRID